MVKRVLVTGGAGFIGKALCRRLLKAGYEVHVLDLMPYLCSSIDGTIRHEGDITDAKLKDADFWKKIDVCYHLAAMANVNDCRMFHDDAFRVNLYGTFNIAEACRRNDIPLIFISTCCVYGNTPQHPSTEDGPTCPMDLYGATKRAGEEIVKLLPHWVILRYGTTVGPEMRPALATSIFLDQAHNGKPFTITGNGQQTRNWIYIDDLVEGCYLVLKKNVKNEVINLAGKKSYTVYRMAEICAEVVNGTAANTSWEFLPAREGDVFREDISIKKAKKLLGWQPKVDLKEALEISYKRRYR